MELLFWDYSVVIDEEYVDQSPAEIERQVTQYRRGERSSFDLGVAFPDDFTGSVMEAMADIPHGETRTYGELASELDTAAIAIGQACGRNPVPVVIPCHRVVGTNALGGFSADGGVSLKRRLLAHESVVADD